jgi:hypothetical protein
MSVILYTKVGKGFSDIAVSKCSANSGVRFS